MIWVVKMNTTNSEVKSYDQTVFIEPDYKHFILKNE